MGKKTKIGRGRKDKFYQLAKESGYRSRAAFKLLQLNRTYHFLEQSRICVDLCAAPGGWLQVAATHMPLSSVIIGVDLAPIKPISHVITHCEDITSSKCRQLLKKDLSDNKADVILHDGAPNVGKNWLHDAYQQNMLVLQAFKLATEFLRKGGWFITKVFRSKDYFSLLWVFQQLFKKVDSTKPQASRNESAEIFVICQNYLAPDSIDEKFFDIKYVFNDVNMELGSSTANRSNLMQKLLKPPKRNREGYEDNDMTLYHRLNASEFIKSNNFIELLAKSNEIVIDDEKIANHCDTTGEIKECLKDIRLLGKNEIKNLLKWRLKLKEIYENNEQKSDKKGDEDVDEDDDDVTVEEDDEEENKLNDEIEKSLDNEKKLEKKKRRKLLKEKRKLRDKLALKMENPNDTHDFDLQGDKSLFSLNKIKTKQQLLALQTALPGIELFDDDDNNGEDDDIDIESGLPNRRRTKASYSKDKEDLDDFYASIENKNGEDEEDLDEIDDNDDDKIEGEGGSDNDNDEEDNPLITDLVSENKEQKKKLLANSWFSKSAFDFLKDDDDDDENEDELLDDLIEDGKKKEEKKSKVKKRNRNTDEDDNDEEEIKKMKKKSKDEDDDKKVETKDDKKSVALTPYELALGEMIVTSNRNKSYLIDESYNRYSKFHDEDNLPTWFVEDEQLHNQKQLPVPEESIKKYSKKFEAINTRPIKKVVEAQARKKRRMSKKLDKARVKAEAIAENMDMTDKERSKEIKQVYKRAGLLGKKKVEVKYVVAKKHAGKRGVTGKMKGPYKVVDKRLKKDKRRKDFNKNKKKKNNNNKSNKKKLAKKVK